MAQTLDTAFLQAHDPDQHASLAVGAVAIVDGTAPDYERLKSLLAERIQPIARCTQLLRAQPRNQEWIDCPDFDLAHHLRRVAIPRPGDEAELSRAIAYALERPLDSDRPPWECWIIEGLTGNRWAILMKTHHGLLDGNPAARLISRLCDDADADTFANNAAGKQVSPSTSAKPGWADALWRASLATGNLTGALIDALWPVVRTDAVSTLRRYSTVRVPIADVDSVCRKFGVSANDVALAAITEGFRTALIGRGEQPRADSLRALVPLPVRSAMLSHLPVEHDDPVRRLQTVHTRWQAKQAAQPLGIAESVLGLLPKVLRSNVLQLLSRVPQRAIVTLATNVPGPRRRLRVMGQTLERLLPIPPTATALHTGVAVLSYGDELVFGITAEHGDAFDVKQLAAGIELGMARLVALGDDSVLLFTRKRSPRRVAGPVPPTHPSAPGRARH
ncbi:wax ester/triacylglycerol synthase domain-containing protein [Mycobacterium sp. 1245801.1]|uniref:wax ester/triacylglycerol synthase domain-containing protein n=1 Tax=Mycobacterium sp. 1245801.1 TaxID=1834075 RepID=UPI00080162CC|nr:wax ester/triacylglycerol synthase domain-containing protein [Mycobacterium sp. 1245801.1]OBJ14277.1 diacylglycerol O-acyltransferase [Mycobacterium sp. 1245801.1]